MKGVAHYWPKAGKRVASRPEEIASGVYWLQTGRGITESDVYFVASGSSWVLIDAAWPWCAQLIKQSAESVFGANAPPAAILLTHDHLDHAGSALELARRWGCPVYVHPDELPFVAPGDLSTLERVSANPLDRWVILPLLRAMPRRRVESMLSDTRLKEVTRAFDPDASVPGLPEWECIPTPGHMPGHVSFFRESDRVLIAGDAVSTVNLNSLRDFALQKQKLSGPPYITTWNWRAAKDSVAALARLEPRVIAGGHGIPMTGPDTADALCAFAERFAAGREQQPARAPRQERSPHMARIEGEIDIDRPVEEVFDVVADERNEPHYNPRLLWVEKISSGPIGRGARFRAATNTMGRPVDMTIEVTDYERPRRLGSLTHMPAMEIRDALTFDPVREGTRMRWSWELQPRGVMRLPRPLIARMGERQEKVIWASLKQFLEAQEASLPRRPDE